MVDPRLSAPTFRHADATIRPMPMSPPTKSAPDLAELADPTKPALEAPDPKQAEIDAILAGLEPDRLPVASVESTALALVPRDKRSKSTRTRPAFGPNADYSPSAMRARPSPEPFYVDDRTRSTEDAPAYPADLSNPFEHDISSAEWSPLPLSSISKVHGKSAAAPARSKTPWLVVVVLALVIIAALGVAVAAILGAFGAVV
jgi:hypothetical protein